jgi:hypothetical protein
MERFIEAKVLALTEKQPK